MKTKAILLAGLFVIFGLSARAQESLQPAVKILPTAEKGVLKVLYAYPADHAVNVKIFNEDDVLLSDQIKADSFQKGFLRKYDIRKIGAKSFFVEVSSESMTVTYKMTKSKERQQFIPALEKVAYRYPALASSN